MSLSLFPSTVPFLIKAPPSGFRCPYSCNVFLMSEKGKGSGPSSPVLCQRAVISIRTRL